MKNGRKIMLAIFIIIILALGISNFKNEGFWSVDIVDIINIGLVFLVAFYFTEILNDKRRKFDAIERIILEVRSNVVDETFFSTEKESITLQASCAQKIKYLSESNTPEIKEDIDYIAREIEEIQNLHSEHFKTDLDSVVKDFERHKLHIINKCDKIQITLYKD